MSRTFPAFVLICMFLVATSNKCHAAELPATGQTATYAAGDDGDVQAGVAWPSPRFTASGGCITDTLTGLTWVSSPDSTGRDWTGALSYAQGLDLCGYTDWRLPNINEIESLMNFTEPSPATWLNSHGFSNVQSYIYWLSTTYANSTGNAHVVYTSDGSLGAINKTWTATSVYTLPVRGTSTGSARVLRTGQTASFAAEDDGNLLAGAAWPSPRYTASGDCVTDNLTGLMWANSSDATTMTWPDALTSANDLTLCGYSDWRLPNIVELRSLMNYGVTDTAEWLNSNGFTNVRSLIHWSSTTSSANTSYAWVLDLANGYLNMTGWDAAKADRNHYVLPVRTTGSFPDINVADPVAPSDDFLIPFGNMTEGTTADQTVTITNNGSANLVIGTIAVVDPLGAPFSITADDCSGMSIAPAATCTVTIRFAPVSTGSFSDSFDVPSNDPDTASVTITVSGTGLSNAVNNPPSAPVLVSPSNGQTVIGSTVQFRWKRSADPDNDPVTYHLYTCPDSGFTNCTPTDTASTGTGKPYLAGMGVYSVLGLIGIMIGSGRNSGKSFLLLFLAVLLFTGFTLTSCKGKENAAFALRTDDVTYTMNGLISGNTLYWKVVADDGRGGVAESEVRSFKTQ